MIAILIYAHKDKSQIQRLVNTLKNEQIDIYVHADKKFDIDNFENAFLIKNRYDIKWGDYSIINSIISSLEEIRKNKKYDYYILLSGQDYPIVSPDEIIKFLNNNSGKEFIEFKKIGNDKNDWNVSNRYTYYHFVNNEFLDKISRHIYNKRNFVKNWVIYGGSLWWTLTDEAIEYIINTYYDLKLYNKIKCTLCFDEIIFQSILCNSKFKDNIVNKNYRYIDWSDHIAGKNSGNPNVLGVKDYDKIVNSGDFFARKFDINVDEKILDMLDEVRK